ncbi:DUF2255 family protein [Chitinophaga sp. 30R24]|uniref:DUF2255 family protein n=1 Tax=Chitinophaga sp. 30R24 TaxID=3248838 RepID=UPI003B8FEB58
MKSLVTHPFPDHIIKYVNTHDLIGIKAGGDRDKSIEIWMVVVDDRIFARSWGLAERSWFTAFQEDPTGVIECGDEIVPVTAIVIPDDHELNVAINKAYLLKYNHGENAMYAREMIDRNHLSRTVELKAI